MIFLGLGVFDAGYYAQIQAKLLTATHQSVRYQSETYTRDLVGLRYNLKLNHFVSVASELNVGYEHHYDSKLYARSYAVTIPEFGIQTNQDYINVKMLWTPAKYFVKLSREPKFTTHLFRAEPSVSIGIFINLEHTLWIPKPVNVNYLNKKKKLP
jgi:hypothetical protein